MSVFQNSVNIYLNEKRRMEYAFKDAKRELYSVVHYAVGYDHSRIHEADWNFFTLKAGNTSVLVKFNLEDEVQTMDYAILGGESKSIVMDDSFYRDAHQTLKAILDKASS